MCNFAHLHCHTDSSPDGLGTVESRVSKAHELGFHHLAMTDHGTLSNTVLFVTECNRYGITPIVGLEPYLLYKGNRYHMTLLSHDQQSYHSLVDLNNKAHQTLNGRYPCITMEMLEQHNDLIALTGCPASAAYEDDKKIAYSYIDNLVDIFSDNVYTELMFVDDGKYYDKLSDNMKMFGKRLPKVIVTNDVHYNSAGQEKLHDIITECRSGYSYSATGLHLASEYEMTVIAGNFLSMELQSDANHNMIELLSKFQPIDLVSKVGLPSIEDSQLKIYNECQIELLNRYGNSKKVIDRFTFEFDFLKSRGFLDYFYIVWDLVEFAKSNNIFVGPGRGSAAGCLISYLLGITDVDPIEYQLSFERFLNKARDDFPDIDLDFESARKQEIVNYAKEKYNAHPISTVSRYHHNSLLDDIGRQLNLDFNVISSAKNNDDNFKSLCDRNELVNSFYTEVIGQQRHKGKHAGGVAIIPEDIQVPIEKVGTGKNISYAIAFSEGYNKELTQIGLQKFDILAISALDQLHRMYDLCDKLPPSNPSEDENCINWINENSAIGIFQFGTWSAKKLIEQIKPKTFDDLIVINALNRPGTLDSGTAQKYTEYKNNPRKIFSTIDEILKDTFGIIVYQEQVMAIYAEVTGESLAAADVARRVLSPKSAQKLQDPKWQAEVKVLEDKFFNQGLVNGFTNSVLELLWSEIKAHCRYSFNKAHATSYAMIAYRMLWYAYNEPFAYNVAMFESDVSNKFTYLKNLVNLGYTIKTPHVNISEANALHIDGDSLYLPLCDVANLAATSASKIIANRPYDHQNDFDKLDKRSFNKRVVSKLFALGCLSDIEGLDLSKIDYSHVLANDLENQIKHLGYFIPKKEIIEYMKSSKPFNVGLIIKITAKTTKYGPMTRYHCIDGSSFWLREHPLIDVLTEGMLLKYKINNFGKAIEVLPANDIYKL